MLNCRSGVLYVICAKSVTVNLESQISEHIGVGVVLSV